MALQMERDYRMRWMDLDRYGHVQPFAIMDMLQDLAILQAEDMGIGRTAMDPRGVFWAIIRLKYEVLREPRHFEHVIVRTWPHSPSRFSFMRDFDLRADNGEVLVRCTTEWVLMDKESRKFVSVRDVCEANGDYLEERAFESKPRKIADFEEDPDKAFVVVPRYSDIDVNGHVNNAKYANFAIDALDPHGEMAVRTFQIDYRHEVFPGEPLSMFTQRDGSEVLAKGVRGDGATAFACKIELA